MYVGDSSGYGETCALLPKRFHSEKAYATFENELASASTIGTSADADLEWALHMAQKAVKGQPAGAWNYTALGLVHYRRGQYEQAIVQLEQSLKVDGSWIAGGHTYPVLAMAYHRLGRKEKVREGARKNGTIDRPMVQRLPSCSCLVHGHALV